MSSTLASAVPDTFRQAARGAQSLIRDVKDDLEDSLEKGRHLARAGRRAISRAATNVERYADDNTALVTVGALLAGVLVGVLVRRRR
ncbi:MAG: LPXTG cell wall anchor domain-containing protein [Thermoanaerobaculia bacterium]